MRAGVLAILALAMGCRVDEPNRGASRNEAVDEGYQTGGEAGPDATAPTAGTPTPTAARGDVPGEPTTGVREGHPEVVTPGGEPSAATVRPGAGSAATENAELLQGQQGTDGAQGTNGYGTDNVPPGTAQNQGTQQGANVDARENIGKALANLHQGHIHEIALARLAVDKATTPAVKDYADKLLRGHTAADDELVTLARAEGIELDAASQKQNAEQLATYARLKDLTGTAFEQAYVDEIVQEHGRTITVVTEDLATIQDPEVKSYLDGLLPDLQQHLKDGQELMRKPKEGGT